MIRRGIALDDRHPRAEPAEDLREFEADIGAADDQQMLGQLGRARAARYC